MRIEEPFIKGRLALWLVSRGAKIITVSIDGAEPHAGSIGEILVSAGFSHEKDTRSRTAWAGLYRGTEVTIAVGSKPGADVVAVFPGKRSFCAECKGECTPSQRRAAKDRAAFYTGLGQLLMIAGQRTNGPEELALVLPETDLYVRMGGQLNSNPLLKRAGVQVLLVDATGQVKRVE